ncbi:hypothetical protein HTZ97_01310 [Desulfuromonas acetoxidans]|uniref:Asparagine synthetase domain-containing protein n=1 Tax=Desulfuromonas acetoxidans (strain DSM 684 / 11070) TaxID=281689 RepID=Q1K414_DESA6|nr:hypothetical protein [Desulfuromonas acetoxidans]EAT17289.1 conserved hypothetical protein [Desulfuromonas acetoxidans DSM 684]MBF0646163.1 hypothetical protein [Desulfuromonas acetoxidans]NVD25974.1 hypothetical protein [Desulfuromonas acetoxidans]NVE15106.1 hypothetical protein [Desulfuromonas acetoxidans]
MKLQCEKKQHWPKLAWVCVVEQGSETARLFHGPMVEISDLWAVEGVWNRSFADGDFDKTDLVFGSGVRVRPEGIYFVSSATGMDRLWFAHDESQLYVSNTLPGLLNIAGLSLLDDYAFYSEDLVTVQTKGLNSHVPSIPSSGPELHVVYYDNLFYDGTALKKVSKQTDLPDLSNYGAYKTFMRHAAELIGENATSKQRAFPVEMLVGLSTGYDSVATAVVAKFAGCQKASSIENSSSFWRGSDSGEKIAPHLGLECRLCRHEPKHYRHEVAVWAGVGRPGGRNLTVLDFPKPLCLFFSGGYGDVVWDRNVDTVQELKGGVNEMMGEFRLIEGVFNCVVPWWGIQRVNQIKAIGRMAEMAPWTLHNDYDRPVARRLIEEAGVPRGLFAQRKKDTSSNSPLWWPATAAARSSLNRYLQKSAVPASSHQKVTLYSMASFVLNLAYKNTVKRIGIKKWWRPWLTFPGRKHLFVWANHTLRDEYYGKD